MERKFFQENEFKYDENKNKILEAGYKSNRRKVSPCLKNEFKDHKIQIILDAKYEVKEGKGFLLVDPSMNMMKNNTILDAKYESEDENESSFLKNI